MAAHQRRRPRRPGPLGRLRAIAEAAPASRDRYVDFLRALAIVLVVLGHWLATVVTTGDGTAGDSALAHLWWARPLTWSFQVMPVFFLVGGYANAASVESHARKGGDGAGWLLGRGDRLLRPTTTFLLVLWSAALAARLLGADPGLVGLGAWAATIPLWFLAAYLGAVLLTPAVYALYRRHGAAVPVVMAGSVLLLDVLRLGLGVSVVGQANHLLVWLTLYQLGFMWRDRWRAAGPLVPSAAAAAGFGLLLLLTTAGPYPASMVDVPGAESRNASPPTFALLVLGVSQAALVLALASPLRRALARPGPWTAVVAVNAVVLTLFLWHMTAAVLTGALLHGTGLLPEPPVGSGEWLLLRIPWLVSVAAVMAVLLAAFGGVEARTASSGTALRVGALRGESTGGAARNLLVWVSMAVVIASLVWIAVAGPGDHGPGALPTAAVIAYVVGAAALHLAAPNRLRLWRGSGARLSPPW